MKHASGFLYLLTALGGLYWSLYLTMTGIYGLPFSYWYLVIFIGSVILFVGAILRWASTKSWARWLPVVGSAMLLSYFAQVLILGLRTRMLDAIRLLWIVVLLTCFLVAIRASMSADQK